MELNFNGILESFDITFLSEKETLSLFIKNNIYIHVLDYKPNKEYENSSIHSFPIYYVNDKKIYNFNYKILEEIVSELYRQIENNHESIKEDFIEFLNWEIERCITASQQKKLLKKLNKEIIISLENEPLAPLYFDRKTSNFGFKSFLQFIYYCCNNPTLIKLYLMNPNFSIYDDFCLELEFIKPWKKLIEIKATLPILNEFINNNLETKIHLETCLTNNKVSVNSSLIFKNNGHSIFLFLSKLYEGKKNTAFYSYLYFFMKNKGLLICEDDDSLEYRKFVITNSELTSFQRIQKTESNVRRRQDKLFNFFEKHYSDFN